MTKIVMFNGPPNCGKDTAANAMQQYFGIDLCAHVKLSEPLKRIVRDFTLSSVDTNLRPFRDMQIGIFQAVAKVLGQDWLGRSGVAQINKLDQEIIVVSDGGRSQDIEPLIQHFGANNLLIVQIVRRGCTFENDIRQYIHDSRIKTEIINNSEINEFVSDIRDIVTTWLSEA